MVIHNLTHNNVFDVNNYNK